jgi:hypothetical protein
MPAGIEPKQRDIGSGARIESEFILNNYSPICKPRCALPPNGKEIPFAALCVFIDAALIRVHGGEPIVPMLESQPPVSRRCCLRRLKLRINLSDITFRAEVVNVWVSPFKWNFGIPTLVAGYRAQRGNQRRSAPSGVALRCNELRPLTDCLESQLLREGLGILNPRGVRRDPIWIYMNHFSAS